MCLNEYAMRIVVEDRLRALRHEADRRAAVAHELAPLRVRLGHSLVRIGRWLAAPAAASRPRTSWAVPR